MDGGEGKGAATVEGLAATQKVKHASAAPGLDTRPRETKPVQRHIHNGQKAEMTQMPTSWWTNNAGCTWGGTLVSLTSRESCHHTVNLKTCCSHRIHILVPRSRK